MTKIVATTAMSIYKKHCFTYIQIQLHFKNSTMKKLISLISLFFVLFSGASFAKELTVENAENHYLGMAKPWQLGFQEPASPVMERLVWMHNNVLLEMCIGISIFVLGLLLYICLRFSRKRNPISSKTTHNTLLEVIWTTVPILILLAITIPSLRLHYFMEHTVDHDMTVKVVGYQWYWGYEYPDNGGFNYESRIVQEKDLKPDDIRLLTVDNKMVVPVGTKVRLILTGADVIHSFAVPAFGIKRDAIPGRLNETWFEATKIGTFYGQCSELCGVGHGFMPIVVEVVSKDDFAKWVAVKAKK